MSEKLYLGDGVYAEFDKPARGAVMLTQTPAGPEEFNIYLTPKSVNTLLILLREHALDWAARLAEK